MSKLRAASVEVISGKNVQLLSARCTESNRPIQELTGALPVL
jgi:hypothetical protein